MINFNLIVLRFIHLLFSIAKLERSFVIVCYVSRFGYGQHSMVFPPDRPMKRILTPDWWGNYVCMQLLLQPFPVRARRPSVHRPIGLLLHLDNWCCFSCYFTHSWLALEPFRIIQTTRDGCLRSKLIDATYPAKCEIFFLFSIQQCKEIVGMNAKHIQSGLTFFSWLKCILAGCGAASIFLFTGSFSFLHNCASSCAC